MKPVRMNIGGMEALAGALEALGQGPVVRVGIFGDKNGREKVAALHGPVKPGKLRRKIKGTVNVLTNAEVGFVHEFGSVSRRIPTRSFLRMPVWQMGNQIVKEASEGFLAALIKKGVEVVPLFFKRLGIAAEGAIQDAFDTRGFGTWAPNRASTVKRKGSDAPLIDSAQLRRAISSQVIW